jgi:hypothetical protein
MCVLLAARIEIVGEGQTVEGRDVGLAGRLVSWTVTIMDHHGV